MFDGCAVGAAPKPPLVPNVDGLFCPALPNPFVVALLFLLPVPNPPADAPPKDVVGAPKLGAAVDWF